MALSRSIRCVLLSLLALAGAACTHAPLKAPEPVQVVPPAEPPAPPAPEPAVTAESAPPLEPAAPLYTDLFDRVRAGFQLEDVAENAVDMQLFWFANHPDYLERSFQRSELYLYDIAAQIEKRGMPLELALLPMIESAYEPYAYSRARASGLWQFIPGTGSRFDLKQDWWYDGRRDVVESTRAALDYLQALHDQFDGDWLLALSAYNVGENTGPGELDFNRANGKPTDFWHLRLPAETRAYVPKLLALKRLMAEPERYGLEFAVIPNEPYFAVIDTDSQIDLKIAAQLAGTSYDELVALNPGYNRWATDPDGPHRLLVPIDNADAFDAALKTLEPDDRVRFASHEVNRKETLPRITKQYGTTPIVISKINDLKDGKIAPGQTLKIPEISGQLPDKVLLAASRVDRPETDLGGRKQRQIVYRVRAGETLNSIARRHGMPVSTLARLNNLGAGDPLIKGQRLVIKASARRYRDEGLKSGRRTLYTVRQGDTVYSISHQFQVSVIQLKSWNGLNKRHQIRAGQHLVMYVDPARQQG